MVEVNTITDDGVEENLQDVPSQDVPQDTGTAPSSNVSPTISVFNTPTLSKYPAPGTTLNGSGNLVIIDHGDWSAATKDAIHDGGAVEAPLVPEGTLFCHREADDVDWYIYSRSEPSVFKYGSVLATCISGPKGFIVQSVFFDKQRLFPANSRVLEIQNYAGPVDGVHKIFEHKYYNPVAKTITEFPITTADLKSHASSVKDSVEQSGIKVNGFPVATDRASQAMITQTVVGLQLVPIIVINWKNPDGSSTVLSGDFIRVMGAYVVTHVANVFNLYPTVISKIEDGTLTNYADIDSFYHDNITTSFTFTPPSANVA